MYSPYPNALLSLRYILEVARIILRETSGAGHDPEVTEEIKIKQQETLEAELQVRCEHNLKITDCFLHHVSVILQ